MSAQPTDMTTVSNVVIAIATLIVIHELRLVLIVILISHGTYGYILVLSVAYQSNRHYRVLKQQ